MKMELDGTTLIITTSDYVPPESETGDEGTTE